MASLDWDEPACVPLGLISSCGSSIAAAIDSARNSAASLPRAKPLRCAYYKQGAANQRIDICRQERVIGNRRLVVQGHAEKRRGGDERHHHRNEQTPGGEQHGCGPQEIELLLDRKRPEHPGRIREAAQLADKKVGEIKGVPAEIVAHGIVPRQRGDEYDQIIDRENPQETADIEDAELFLEAGTLIPDARNAVHEDACNQEPGEDEKQLDAEHSGIEARYRLGPEMTQHHCRDCNCAQPVEFVNVRRLHRMPRKPESSPRIANFILRSNADLRAPHLPRRTGARSADKRHCPDPVNVH